MCDIFSETESLQERSNKLNYPHAWTIKISEFNLCMVCNSIVIT